jgi:hypothetical protein
VADQKVVVLISDGSAQPPLSSSDRAALVNKANHFKASGGVIIGIGVRAANDGFNLLRDLASGGFFLNVWDASQVAAAMRQATGFLGYLCGGSKPPPGYGYTCVTPPIFWPGHPPQYQDYSCLDAPPGPQIADPNPLADNEILLPTPPPPVLPQLPAVTFTPGSGTVGDGLAVALSVPGHPAARIRFSLNVGSAPADPMFGGAGQDYDGGNVPLLLAPNTATTYVKAIAKEDGWINSAISTASYAPGTPGAVPSSCPVQQPPYCMIAAWDTIKKFLVFPSDAPLAFQASEWDGRMFFSGPQYDIGRCIWWQNPGRPIKIGPYAVAFGIIELPASGPYVGSWTLRLEIFYPPPHETDLWIGTKSVGASALGLYQRIGGLSPTPNQINVVKIPWG